MRGKEGNVGEYENNEKMVGKGTREEMECRNMGRKGMQE